MTTNNSNISKCVNCQFELVQVFQFCPNCGKNTNPKDTKISIFLDTDSNLWGIKDDYDNVVVKPEFDSLGFFGALDSTKFIRAQKNRRWGIINLKTEWIVPPIYEYIKTVGSSENGGIITVIENGKQGFIYENGTILIKPMFEVNISNYLDSNDEWDITISNFNKNGLCLIRLNEKIGFINTSGNWVIPPIYDHSFKWDEWYNVNSKFGDFQILGITKNETLHYTFINFNGEILMKETYIDIEELGNGMDFLKFRCRIDESKCEDIEFSSEGIDKLGEFELPLSEIDIDDEEEEIEIVETGGLEKNQIVTENSSSIMPTIRLIAILIILVVVALIAYSYFQEIESDILQDKSNPLNRLN